MQCSSQLSRPCAWCRESMCSWLRPPHTHDSVLKHINSTNPCKAPLELRPYPPDICVLINCLLACLPLPLPACLPACLPASLPACLSLCLPASLSPSIPTCSPACLPPVPCLLQGPVLLRLAYHDAGTFSTQDGKGGSNASIQFELDRPENTGLKRGWNVIQQVCGRAGGPPQTSSRGGGRRRFLRYPYPPVDFMLSGSQTPTPLSVLGSR